MVKQLFTTEGGTQSTEVADSSATAAASGGTTTSNGHLRNSTDFRGRRLTCSHNDMSNAASMVQLMSGADDFDEDVNPGVANAKNNNNNPTTGLPVAVTKSDQVAQPNNLTIDNNNANLTSYDATQGRESFRSRRLTFSKQEIGIAAGMVQHEFGGQDMEGDHTDHDGPIKSIQIDKMGQTNKSIPQSQNISGIQLDSNQVSSEFTITDTTGTDINNPRGENQDPTLSSNNSNSSSKSNFRSRRLTFSKQELGIASSAVKAMKDVQLSDDEDDDPTSLGNVPKRPSVSSLSDCSTNAPAQSSNTNFRSRRLTFSKQEMGSAAAAILKDVELSDEDDEVGTNRGKTPASSMIDGKPSSHTNNATISADGSGRMPRRSSTASDATAITTTTDGSISTNNSNFRSRRLSCSKQEMNTTAAAIAVMNGIDLSDDDDDGLDGNLSSAKPAATSNTMSEEMDSSNNVPDPNFRSRRLTCSKQEMGAAAAAVLNNVQLSDDEDTDNNNGFIQQKDNLLSQKKRKPLHPESGATSTQSIGKTLNLPSKPQLLQTRDCISGGSSNEPSQPSANSSIQHRSTQDVSGTAVNNNTQFPFSSRKKQKCEDTDTSSEHAMSRETPSPLPSKKSQHVKKNDVKDKMPQQNTKAKSTSKLPYSRNVVGTFSCHGIEPCHGSGSRANTAVAKINQDRGGVSIPYASSPRTALFAVYDGHGKGGEYVSQHALHEIPRRLEQATEFKMGNYEKAFQKVFLDVDEDLVRKDSIDPMYSGCTACVILMLNKLLYIANVGDSRAVIGQRTQIQQRQVLPEGYITSQARTTTAMRALDLSVDQNPDSPGEKERIERSGGFVSPPAEEGLSSRVWLDHGCTQIGLAMSRSIGDHVVNAVGVIAEPVVTKYELKEEDSFLVIATDGVWEFLSSQEVVDMVNHDLRQGKGSSEACQNLIKAAAAKWHEYEGDYRDDITALVVKVKELWN